MPLINSSTLDAQQNIVFFSNEIPARSFNNVQLQFESGGGYPGQLGNYYIQKSKMFFTNLRMVLLNSDKNAQIKTFEIPLSYLSNVQLHQPIFGCNSITAIVDPIPLSLVQTPGEMILWFKEGGASEFYMFYKHLSQEQQIREEQPPVGEPVQETLPVYSSTVPEDHTTLDSGLPPYSAPS